MEEWWDLDREFSSEDSEPEEHPLTPRPDKPPPAKFTLFLDLPKELQVSIWEWAGQPSPRLVPVRWPRVAFPGSISAMPRTSITKVKVFAPPNPLLRTCHEARGAALNYTLAFGDSKGGPVFINFENDTIYCGSINLFFHLCGFAYTFHFPHTADRHTIRLGRSKCALEWQNQVRRLAVFLQDQRDIIPFCGDAKLCFPLLHRLKTLSLEVHGKSQDLISQYGIPLAGLRVSLGPAKTEEEIEVHSRVEEFAGAFWASREPYVCAKRRWAGRALR